MTEPVVYEKNGKAFEVTEAQELTPEYIAHQLANAERSVEYWKQVKSQFEGLQKPEVAPAAPAPAPAPEAPATPAEQPAAPAAPAAPATPEQPAPVAPAAPAADPNTPPQTPPTVFP